MRAKYCKSKNTYTINECRNCNCPEYWKQGIGYIGGSAYVDSGGNGGNHGGGNGENHGGDNGGGNTP